VTQPVSSALGAAATLDTSTPAYRTKVAHAAEKFEGFFIGEILQQMRRSMRDIDPDAAENAKRGENDMTDMADTLLADNLSHRHAFGIADAILRQLLPAKSPEAPGAASSPGAAGSQGASVEPAALKFPASPVASSK
jgi:peptidoglycan hydrolase FlgJ